MVLKMFSRIIYIFLIILATTEAFFNVINSKIPDRSLSDNFDNSNEVEIVSIWSYQKQSLKKEKNLYEIQDVKPPPPDEGAKMARYIVHNSEWASLGTTSSMPTINGYPFTDIFSISDGPILNSTGVPYLYMTPLNPSSRNVEKDKRCSMSFTLAQSDYCTSNHLDPQDPRCAHLILTGKIFKVKKGSDDETFARNALFSRHPAMKTWPNDHEWYFAKMEIEKISLVDYFGGPKHISIDDYFNAKI